MNLTLETCEFCGFAGVYLHSRETRDIYSEKDQWRETAVLLQCLSCKTVYLGWYENERAIDGPKEPTIVYKNRLITRER